MDLLSLFDGSADYSEGCAVTAGCEGTGVAMGKDAADIGHEVGTVGSNGFAVRDVLVIHFERFSQERLLDVVEGGP